MIQTGFVGGRAAQLLLRRLGREASQERGYCSGDAYAGQSKLEALFGPGIRTEVCGKRVLDFGCGDGAEAVEIAERGAEVVGVDIRPRLLEAARDRAERAGVSSRCRFGTEPDGRFDAVFSIDGFEHYADPAGVLRLLRGLLRPGGRVYAAFGPPWFHPFGGHLFSVFPWAHLIFTEKALLRWRSDFKSDGARRFHEVEGGLNQMTVARFKRLVAASGLYIDSLELVPVRRLRRFFNPLTRELFTSIVRCELVKERGFAFGRAAG
jgi:SAM-dependent methyltransferase